jgi:AcrR family transcriptional regulator
MALAPEPDQRGRILEAALRLMAVGGAHAMSMRRLAAECGLNVATLYHYFPSKADLLREVIAHQSYDDLLTQAPPVDRSLAPRERLAELLEWIWREMTTQDDMWRVLLGESLHADPAALASAAELSALFETALERWLTDLLEGDLPAETPTVARVLRGTIYGFFVENLPLPYDDRMRYLRKRAREVAAVLVGGGAKAQPEPDSTTGPVSRRSHRPGPSADRVRGAR